MSDPNYRLAQPTRLVQLHQVRVQDAGIKIRFLGCVHAYDVDSGIMTLREHFPTTAKSRSADTASVNINDVLEAIDHSHVQVGAWLNIVGYVRKSPEKAQYGGRHIRIVDATLVWSAGAIKLDAYKTAVQDYNDTLHTG